MKKVFTIFLIVTLNLSASEIYVDYSTQKIDFKTVDLEMTGGTVGLSWGDQTHFYIEGNIQNDSDKNINYYDVVMGLNGDIVKNSAFKMSWDVGIGVGQLDVPWYANKNTLLSLPVGIDMTYNITDKLMLNAGLGYKYFFDLTEDQTYCNDGTVSESTGSGTCSWHGGIAGYSNNDFIGNGGGMSAQVGLTFKF